MLSALWMLLLYIVRGGQVEVSAEVCKFQFCTCFCQCFTSPNTSTILPTRSISHLTFSTTINASKPDSTSPLELLHSYVPVRHKSPSPSPLSPLFWSFPWFSPALPSEAGTRGVKLVLCPSCAHILETLKRFCSVSTARMPVQHKFDLQVAG